MGAVGPTQLLLIALVILLLFGGRKILNSCAASPGHEGIQRRFERKRRQGRRGQGQVMSTARIFAIGLGLLSASLAWGQDSLTVKVADEFHLRSSLWPQSTQQQA